MTDLNKRIARRARDPQIHYKGKTRRIVVMLEPGDVIAMQLEGSRTAYRAEIKSVYYQLAQWFATSEARRKKKERDDRRNGLTH